MSEKWEADGWFVTNGKVFFHISAVVAIVKGGNLDLDLRVFLWHGMVEYKFSNQQDRDGVWKFLVSLKKAYENGLCTQREESEAARNASLMLQAKVAEKMVNS